MLFKTNVTHWYGIGRDSNVIVKALGTEYVFNVNNISNLLPQGTGSEFLFSTSATDRKSGYAKVYCTTPVATIRGEFDTTPYTNAMELSVFPDNDLSKTPFTTWISTSDFAYAWSHNPYPQYSWMVYNMKGGKSKRVLTDMGLADFLYYDNPSGGTNIQWYVYVDPDEIIVLTKLIVA